MMMADPTATTELDDDVITAAELNNAAVVSKWLKDLPKGDVTIRDKLVQILKRAAQHLSVDVIRLFKPPICTLSKEVLSEIINTTDTDGMTVLHYVAQGMSKKDDVRNEYVHMLEILAHLCEQGGNPTCVSAQGKTAKEIAENRNSKIAVALLEILEAIHCDVVMHSPAPDYEDIDTVHKTLLHWAVHTNRCKVVFHILSMHKEDYEYITMLLFEMDPFSSTGLEAAPIFTAANIGSPELFKALIIHNKIPLSIILRQKQEYTFDCPDGTVIRHVDTPLSLILSRSENYPLIDALVDLDESNSCKHLTSIDLSHTRTCNLPVEIFKLRHLYRINISNNQLSPLSLLKLPQNCWPTLLHDLNISYNFLEQIPSELFKLPCLEVLKVSHNSLKSLPERWWEMKSISELDISFNIDLKSLLLINDGGKHAPPSSELSDSSGSRTLPVSTPRPSTVDGKLFDDLITCRMGNSPLTKLNTSHCSINEFPRILALFFPNLEVLNLSHNKLSQCCAINEMPTSLTCLDISYNSLNSHFNEHEVFHIDKSLFKRSNHMLHKDLCNLHNLKLANNVDLKMITLVGKTESSECHIFFPNLLNLDLSNCGLRQAPCYLELLQKLTDLDISRNKDLYIPNEIISLEHLVNFTYNDIKDPVVNELKLFTLTREKQVYLHERNGTKNPTVRLIFVGLEEIELVSSLSKSKFNSKDQSINVGDKHFWHMCQQKFCDLVINFDVWNFIGKNEDVSQCFFSDDALYILCWKFSGNKDEGIGNLRNWLLRIHDQTYKEASVVIVGCQTKSISNHLRKHLVTKVQRMREESPQLCHIDITVKFVSNASLKTDILELRHHLYDVASLMKLSLGSKVFNQRLKDMKVPVKYQTFQSLLLSKVELINKHEDGPPILTWQQILRMGLYDPSNPYHYFNNEQELGLAIKYLKKIGVILHFDDLDLSDYYFIDPHWLYDVFCQVCSPSELTSNKISCDDGKVKCSELQKIFDKCGTPQRFAKIIFKLLYQFELAIPLDTDTLLLPSTLQCDPQNKLYSSVNCNFPAVDIQLPVETSSGIINLHSTGMCYRRLFVANHIPEKFWFKLVPMLLSSAEIFYNILLNNCVEGMTLEKMADIGEVVIGNHQCKCWYWRNGVTLIFEDKVLFCINGLMKCGDMSDGSHRYSQSVTTDKIKAMQLVDESKRNQLFPEDGDGIEVNIPDYVVQSSLNGKTHASCKLSLQIQAHVFDILNEVCIAFFRGDFDRGIYSQRYFKQVVVCPYCYGDSPVTVTNSPDDEMRELQATTLHYVYVRQISFVNYVIEEFENVGWYGFNIWICILEAQKNGFVSCPNHGKLNLHCLTPDLMFEDVTLNKIPATNVDQPFAQGGFGAVYKVKHPFDSRRYAALKCFTKPFIINQQDLTIQELATTYGDVRLELNKLASIDHPNIVQFLGLCVISFSFLLEWAHKGDLEQIISKYQNDEFPIRPDTVATTLAQVSSALGYLHTKKSIVHFDIKPKNVLVFRYPQPGQCWFSAQTSLTYDSWHGDSNGVLVKLADLGISAFLGPNGFQRKMATPGYVAPEVLKYSGKEHLTEKVDIFSLGSLLYTIMTLRKLPLEGTRLEFDSNITAGRRPELLPEDPSYPLPLVQCLRSCWEQQHKQRPTAKKIEEIFQKPNCLKLINSYEMKDLVVSAVVVTSHVENEVEEECIWVAVCNKDGSYNLVSNFFADSAAVSSTSFKMVGRRKSLVHPKLYETNHSVKLNGHVKEMCHHGRHIWILYTSGYIAVFDMDSHKIIQNIESQELSNDPVTILVVDHATGLIATAYTNGLIAYLWDCTIPLNDNVSTAYFHSANTIAESYQNFRLTTVESCSDADGHCQMWCGYNIGVIQSVRPPNEPSGETKVLKVLRIDEYSTELPPDTYITQLRFSGKSLSLMYAFHDHDETRGQVIVSCWSVCANPKLCLMIETSITTPASVFLSTDNALYIGDNDGKVYVVDTSQVSKGEYSKEVLPGGHLNGQKVDHLIVLQGKVNTEGFLSAVGVTAIDEQRRPSNMYYANSVPCKVLISIGIGFQDSFTQYSSNSTYFISWALPCSKLYD